MSAVLVVTASHCISRRLADGLQLAGVGAVDRQLLAVPRVLILEPVRGSARCPMLAEAEPPHAGTQQRQQPDAAPPRGSAPGRDGRLVLLHQGFAAGLRQPGLRDVGELLADGCGGLEILQGPGVVAQRLPGL
jgi:hypothetical protein